MSYKYKRVLKSLRRKLFFGAFLMLTVCNLFAQSPLSGIPGLTLWLRADVGVVTNGPGDSVTTWHDQSGNGYDATGAVGSKPTVNSNSLNGLPAIKFNTTNLSFLSGPQITQFNNNGSICGLYAFIICKADGNSSGNHGGIFTIGSLNGLGNVPGWWFERLSFLGALYLNNNAANPATAYLSNSSGMGGTGTSTYKMFEVRKIEGQSTAIDVNTSTVTSTTTAGLSGSDQAIVNGTFTNGTYNIGLSPGYASPDGYFNGEIAEIILFDTCLNGAQIAQVESYLGTKYSPTVHIGPRDTTITHGLCALPLTAPTGFVSYTWSTGATTNSISVSTSGTYSVIIKDAFGAYQYDTTTVTFPTLSLNPTATVCVGDSLELVPNVPSFSNYTFKWNPGNQTTDSIKVGVAGTYKVVVTDALNTSCSVTTNAEVVSVDNFKSTVSLGSATTLCSGNRLSLVTPVEPWNQLHFLWSTGSVDSLIWVNTPAAYSVTVTDAIGCSGSASVTVTIAGTAPHVNFTTTPVCQGLPYSPYNNSDSVNVKYAWAFGDGGTGTGRFASHNYLAADTFLVKLTVTDTIHGCVNDSIIPLVVNALPTAAYQSSIACDAITFTFDNLSAPAPGQTISSYYWQFDNTATDTSSSINPSFTYGSVDTFHVRLTITQANGCMAIDSVDSIIVQLPSNVPSAPVLQFPASGSISADTVVTFKWASSAGALYYDLFVSTDPSFPITDSSYYNIYTNQKKVTLASNQTYYWKVSAVNPCGVPNSSVGFDTVYIMSPANIAGGNIAFWLRADMGVVASGGNVIKWMDQSPSNDSATAAGAAEPTFINQVPLLNYMPSIKFGNNNVMTGNPIAGLGPNGSTDQNSLSIFIVARADGPLPSGEPGGIFTIGGLNSGLWIERGAGFAIINNYENNSALNHGSNPPILNDQAAMPAGAACPYHLYGVVKSYGSFARIDTNGVYDTVNYNYNTINFFYDSAFSLGHPAGLDPYSGNVPYGYLNGEIAEVIIFNTLLNPAEQAQVNQYLFNKYAPPVNLGPDIVQNYSLCPVTLRTGNRFVSYLWSTGATSDTLNVTQGGTYWVSAVDVFNHTSFDSIHVTLPYRGSNPDTLFVCHGDTGQMVQLINQPTSYTYNWYYSATAGGTYANLNINSNVIHPYKAGYYYTKISDASSCSIITPKIPLIIDTFYNVQVVPAYDTICKFGTLIINTVPYVIDSFLWSPMAFPMDTMSAPTIDSAGLYYLYTVDNKGCRNLDSAYVTTHAQAPVTNFTIPNLCLSNATYFQDLSVAAANDNINSYNWSYGGGIPSTDTTVNGQTSYRLDYGYGNYTVTLKITTDSGCIGIKTQHITILPSPNVGYIDSANNSLYPYILCAGSSSSAQFTDTSQAEGGSAITERIWKFNGAVNPDSAATIQYSFPQQGIYTVTLEVVNALGCADSVTEQIDVNPPFTAVFSNENHCLGDPTTFTDLTQSLSIVSRVWKFRENGDGPYAYSPTAQITYQQPGTYDVELQVENAIGCISTLNRQVKIVQKPLADFTNLPVCVNQAYAPIDSSFAYGDTLVQWSWNIGGNISHLPSPSVVFHTTGPESVSLTVKSSEGCVDSVTKTFDVAPVPTALFVFNPLYGSAPLQVTFSNRSSGATNFTWYFGDGNSVTTDSPYINPPAYTYNQNGDYNVVLYAYNNYGCFDSLSRLLTVLPTTLDIAVERVGTISVTQPDGSQLVTLTALISNVGTRIINSAQLYASLGGTGIMEQNWSGYLLSGQTILDTFPAQFVVPEGAGNTYVCVSARDVNGGEAEVDTTNNQNCASLTGNMQLAGPMPNPAITNALLGIILPQAGKVYISIIDELGKPVVPEASFNLPVGRTNYIIPVAQLQSAEYYIRVRYNDDTEVRSFVVR